MKHEFFIAGVQHHEYKSCINDLIEGMKLMLIPEPDNKFDPNAVKIVADSILYENDLDTHKSFMLGYVPAKIASPVGAMLEIHDNVTCTITELNPSAKPWEMIKVLIKPEEE